MSPGHLGLCSRCCGSRDFSWGNSRLGSLDRLLRTCLPRCASRFGSLLQLLGSWCITPATSSSKVISLTGFRSRRRCVSSRSRSPSSIVVLVRRGFLSLLDLVGPAFDSCSSGCGPCVRRSISGPGAVGVGKATTSAASTSTSNTSSTSSILGSAHSPARATYSIHG